MTWGTRGTTTAGAATATTLTGVSRGAPQGGDWLLLALKYETGTQKTFAFSNGTWTLLRDDANGNGTARCATFLSRYQGEASTFDITWDGTSFYRAAVMADIISDLGAGDVGGARGAPRGTRH